MEKSSKRLSLCRKRRKRRRSRRFCFGWARARTYACARSYSHGCFCVRMVLLLLLPLLLVATILYFFLLTAQYCFSVLLLVQAHNLSILRSAFVCFFHNFPQFFDCMSFIFNFACACCGCCCYFAYAAYESRYKCLNITDCFLIGS